MRCAARWPLSCRRRLPRLGSGRLLRRHRPSIPFDRFATRPTGALRSPTGSLTPVPSGGSAVGLNSRSVPVRTRIREWQFPVSGLSLEQLLTIRTRSRPCRALSVLSRMTCRAIVDRAISESCVTYQRTHTHTSHSRACVLRRGHYLYGLIAASLQKTNRRASLALSANCRSSRC
jgi:hypothetical protein